MSINCRSVRGKEREIVKIFKERACDFLLLQETRIENQYSANKFVQDLQLKNGWVSYSSKFSNSVEGLGTSILQISDTWEVKKVIRYGGRLTAIGITDHKESLTIVNVYAPAKGNDRKTFFTKLLEILQNIKGEIILIGDFNVTLDDGDIFGTWVGETQLGRTELQEIFDSLNFRDGYRVISPHGSDYSFEHKAHDRRSRIDRIYIGETRQITRHEYLNETITRNWTDHKGLYVHLGERANDINRKPAYWKFNNSLLTDTEYVETIKYYIRAYTNTPMHNSAGTTYEELKNIIRRVTQTYSKGVAIEKRKREEEIKLELFYAELFGNLEKIESLRREKEEMEKYKFKGAAIRCRVDYLEEPTREFLARETSIQRKRIIKGVENTNGQYVTDPEGIKSTFLEFYTELYDRQESNIHSQNRFLEFVRKLNDEQKRQTDEDIKESEILEAISSCKNNKTPGPDGLSAEFFKCFLVDLMPLFKAMIEESLERGELPESLNMSYITLLPKVDNCTQPKQYRPISLLNIDYKIITRVLTNRLQKHMSSLIHIDQASAVKGRTIQTQNHLLRDVIAYAQTTNMHTAVLSLDQVKAFDRVAHDFLFKILEKSNFGPNFQRWIKILYKNPQSKLIINQTLTATFEIKRSVRQGDSLSPLLYNLCVEPLLQKIRSNPEIRGINIPGGREIKVLAYADDNNFFPKTHKSIQLIFEEFSDFGEGSGSAINEQKTQLLPLGSWTDPTPNTLEEFRVDTIKIFGIEYTNKIDQTSYTQWTRTMETLENTIRAYFYKATSIFGRALIVNTVGYAKMNYLLSTLDIPIDILKRSQSLARNFILKGTPRNISLETLILSKLDGGVALQDIQSRQNTFRLKYIKSIIDSPSEYPFGVYYLGISLRGVMKFQNTTPHCSHNPPKFYKQCIALIKNNKELLTSSFNTKKVYQHFIQERQKINLHKQHLFTRVKHSITHGILDLTDTFKNIHTKDFSNIEKQTTWRIIYSNTPTKEGEAKRLNRLMPCRICKRNIQETQRHIFFDCHGASQSLSALRTFLNSPNDGKFSVRATHKALFLNMLDTNDPKLETRIKMILISIYRLHLWSVRLLSVFENASYTASTILDIF